MASTGVAGPGWLLQHGTSISGPWTTITEVKDISGPTQVLEKDEITNQSSPNFYKEWITTLLDGGQVTFSCVFVPGDATQNSATGLLSWMQGRGLQFWQIVPPGTYSAHTIAFTAYVTKWDLKTPVAKAATIDVDLTVTGPVTVN